MGYPMIPWWSPQSSQVFDALCAHVRFDGLSSLVLVRELGRVCGFEELGSGHGGSHLLVKFHGENGMNHRRTIGKPQENDGLMGFMGFDGMIPSGNDSHSYGTWKKVIFHSYVKLPEGTLRDQWFSMIFRTSKHLQPLFLGDVPFDFPNFKPLFRSGVFQPAMFEYRNQTWLEIPELNGGVSRKIAELNGPFPARHVWLPEGNRGLNTLGKYF